MANIILPTQFKDKLEQDQELNGIVNLTLSRFGDILDENKLYFFGEYTNHGIKHIQDVLKSSENMISESTITNILGFKDIGYYILSVILHDIGMHIDLEGFKYLYYGQFDSIRVVEFDKKNWKEAWDDFLDEALKFSGKQLDSIFGDENTIVRMPPISKPGDITENDKKLIGEFLRRNHQRLAHEIALNGFPAKSTTLEFAKELTFQDRNLIGLIARSHGEELRKCLDYSELKYGRDNRRFPCGIHGSYLMILLRIADYIQIDQSRTSNTTIKLKSFSSPISELEHKAHLAIDNVNYRWHDDPERIFVTAAPSDSKMFLKLKKLFENIQSEFDISWAVLGELYGKEKEKDQAKIKFRRISSNLEDELFTNSQHYIADSFTFNANDEIIKLLVAPLYGDNPKYGVRELLQNAVDACKEREIIELENGHAYKPFIKIEINQESDGQTYFKISDNGIGMDSNIIKNYFLSAGASYRKSIDWKKEFTNKEGDSIVRRSGRFGVGILASFLIGSEIYVETKRIHQPSGYKFEANINSDQINILKDSSISIGTIIRIKIDQEKIELFKSQKDTDSSKINWSGWYCLSNPIIKYFIFGEEIIPYKNLRPDNSDSLPDEWNSIDSKGFNKIHWSYSQLVSDKRKFACNGILISYDQYKYHNFIDYRLISNLPYISIFDNNGNLPLTLDRNSFSGELSFQSDLLKDIYKDLIAYLLIYSEISYVDDNKIYLKENYLNHPATTFYYKEISFPYGINRYQYPMNYENYDSKLSRFIDSILISKNGFIVNYNFFIKKLDKINAITFQLENYHKDGFKFDIQDHFIQLTEDKINSIVDYQSAIEPKNWNKEKNEFEPINSRVYLKTEKYKYLFQSDKKRMSAWLNYKCQIKSEKYGFTCLELDNPIPTLISDDFLKRNAKNIHFIRENEITCPYEGDPLLNDLLERYIGDNVVIPYSLEERKKKYPLAFSELSNYMEKYIKSDKSE